MRTASALCIALALSLLANIGAFYQIASTRAVRKTELDKARLSGAIDALKSRADQINRVALSAERDGRQLQAALRAIDADAGRRLQGYQALVAELPPLPSGCGPGKARVDAVNHLIGTTP